MNGNDIAARNLTIENSFDEASVTVSGKQAVALNVRGERQRFDNVRFIGNQDTLLTNGGTQYFYQCYIEGDVDFIFGGSRAVFEACTIHSLDRGSSSNNGYITAASTMITEPYGYLFLNSKLTSNAAAALSGWAAHGTERVIRMLSESVVYMAARWWRVKFDRLERHVRSFAAEWHGCTNNKNKSGPGAAVTDMRRQMTDEQAKTWKIENVLKGWNPNQA